MGHFYRKKYTIKTTASGLLAKVKCKNYDTKDGKRKMLVYICSFIAKHPILTTVESNTSLKMNYSLIKGIIENKTCVPPVCGRLINTKDTTMTESHITEACLQFAVSTDNDLEVFIKVKFNCMSLPTEMLKIICTFFTLMDD